MVWDLATRTAYLIEDKEIEMGKKKNINYINGTKSPCYGCTKRKPGCHDICTDFDDWKADQVEVIENRKEFKRRFAYNEMMMKRGMTKRGGKFR